MSRGPSAIGSPYHRFIAFIPIPILLILAVALFLRLYQLDLIDVRFDEASALQSALAIARGQFVAVAPYSGSVANHPPVYLYVMALPYLFTRNLLVVAGFRALLDVLAIGLTYGLCVRYFNRRVALVCALFYTLSPWAIQLARKTWLAPLPVWGVLLLWGLLEVTQRHNPRAWVLTGLALALAIGTHLSAIYLLPVVLAVALWQRQTLHWRPVLLGVLPCVLLAAFYLGYDAQHGFANLRAVLAGGAAVGKPEWSLNSMRFAFWLSGGAHLSDLTGPAFGTWQAHWSGWLSWIDTLQMMVLGAFFGWAAMDWRNGRGNNASLVLALWFILPVLLLLRPTQPLQLHYLLPLYPVQFVMMGWVAGRWMSNARRLTPVIGGLLAVVLVWQLATTLRFNDFVALQNTAAGGYSEPARTGLAATQLARAGIWDGSYADVIVVASGGDPQVNEAATVMDVFLAEVPHRFVDADAGLVLRGEPTQYVFAPGSELALHQLTQLLPPGDVVTKPLSFGPMTHECMCWHACGRWRWMCSGWRWVLGIGRTG